MKTKTLKLMFNYINRELFDGELDMPYLYSLSTKQCKQLWHVPIDGIFLLEKDKSFIGIHQDLTATQAFDTLAHEMIHQYLVTEQNDWSHGKNFRLWCLKAIDTFYYKML